MCSKGDPGQVEQGLRRNLAYWNKMTIEIPSIPDILGCCDFPETDISRPGDPTELLGD